MKFKHVKALFIASMGLFLIGGVKVSAGQAVHTPGPFAGANVMEMQIGTDPGAQTGENSRDSEKDTGEEKTGKKNRKNKAKKNKKAKKEKKVKKKEPELVIATVSNYLNIRNAPDMDGEIIGKLYNHSVGTIAEETENGWYKIESGTVNGYVKSEYVLRGKEGKNLADEVGQRLARVETTTLRVRKESNTESEIIGLLPDGDVLQVAEEMDGWVKVCVEEGEGYISTDYADVYTENTVAESREEEEARLKREAEERRLAEEAAQEAARQQEEEAGRRATANSSGHTSSTGHTSSDNGTALGSKIANYALQFVGNPYVYGGTSLTNGADCSGFVMSVYRNFGITLPRTSGEQGQCGRDAGGIGNARPGDLVWYSGHIGIYIGNGQIVHASTPASGIKVSNANYRTILSVRRIV